MILALNLYLKMPFGKMHKGNKDVINLAKLIGRTPDAVAYRLVNYASCDPQLRQKGISGMKHGGEKCEKYWSEFVEDRDRLLFESEQILAKRQGISIEEKFGEDLTGIIENLAGEDKIRQVRVRVNQNVFRQIVLANYSGRCALTGIDLPDLLVASHVIPWSKNKEERLNPENGICLSALYDKAFDKGLISFDKNLNTIFSSRLLACVGTQFYSQFFAPVYQKKLEQGVKYPVNPLFLDWHRECIFEK